jgi:hypothetical protein
MNDFAHCRTEPVVLAAPAFALIFLLNLDLPPEDLVYQQDQEEELPPYPDIVGLVRLIRGKADGEGSLADPADETYGLYLGLGPFGPTGALEGSVGIELYRFDLELKDRGRVGDEHFYYLGMGFEGGLGSDLEASVGAFARIGWGAGLVYSSRFDDLHLHLALSSRANVGIRLGGAVEIGLFGQVFILPFRGAVGSDDIDVLVVTGISLALLGE